MSKIKIVISRLERKSIFLFDGINSKKYMELKNGGDSDLVPSKEIKICKNCFIGCNSIILKGTILGDGCVVGAGAVVAGKFESNCVIAGNPARVIKRFEGDK